ncbi:MAG: hypothetical protein IKF06_00660, partial [Lachnospiraceae bacterium]|nr:hypothetical protein [Lachnospiraceae bacterium]
EGLCENEHQAKELLHGFFLLLLRAGDGGQSGADRLRFAAAIGRSAASSGRRQRDGRRVNTNICIIAGGSQACQEKWDKRTVPLSQFRISVEQYMRIAA